jgi:16S rRNA G966 N2-methylase RsmD
VGEGESKSCFAGTGSTGEEESTTRKLAGANEVENDTTCLSNLKKVVLDVLLSFQSDS